MQTDNRILDGMARLFTNTAGAAQAFKSELETLVKARIERAMADLDLVPREEFDAVKAMAAKARAENETLASRIGALEARLGMEEPVQPARTKPGRGKNNAGEPGGKL
jgi:BMFP domain-containing protein YqiC